MAAGPRTKRQADPLLRLPRYFDPPSNWATSVAMS